MYYYLASTVQSNSNGSLFMSPSVASVISTTAFVTTNATANYNATSTAATTGTSITTVTTPANGIATPSPTPTCVCELNTYTIMECIAAYIQRCIYNERSPAYSKLIS